VQNGVPATTPPLTANNFRTGEFGSYDIAPDCTGVMTNNIPNGQKNTFAIALVNYGQAIYGVISGTHIAFLPPVVVPSGTDCSSGCEAGLNASVEFTQNTPRLR
jgi:hypothetical protein